MSLQRGRGRFIPLCTFSTVRYDPLKGQSDRDIVMMDNILLMHKNNIFLVYYATEYYKYKRTFPTLFAFSF